LLSSQAPKKLEGTFNLQWTKEVYNMHGKESKTFFTEEAISKPDSTTVVAAINDFAWATFGGEDSQKYQKKIDPMPAKERVALMKFINKLCKIESVV